MCLEDLEPRVVDGIARMANTLRALISGGLPLARLCKSRLELYFWYRRTGRGIMCATFNVE